MEQNVLDLLQDLTPEQKQYVVSTLPSREKSVTYAYIFWAVFAVYYFYLNKPGKNILLWLTGAVGIGLIWWFIDLFRMKGMVRRYNYEAAVKVVAEARNLYPAKE